MEIDELISYSRMLLQFQAVDRQLMLPNGRNENDVEHSYMLAMAAWYIASKAQLGLNIDAIIKYALAHDVVEVYAGDTYFLDSTKQADKALREEAALEAIRHNYPDFTELHTSLERYEARADAESRFVYALDKLMPVIVNYIAEGKGWHRDNITLEMLRANKDDKVATSAIVSDLWQQMVDKLTKRPELFPAID